MTGTIQKAGAARAATDGFIGRSFLNTSEFPVEEIQELVERVLWLKQRASSRLLPGRSSAPSSSTLSAHKDLARVGRGAARRHDA